MLKVQLNPTASPGPAGQVETLSLINLSESVTDIFSKNLTFFLYFDLFNL